jgi:hypothetical protein
LELGSFEQESQKSDRREESTAQGGWIERTITYLGARRILILELLEVFPSSGFLNVCKFRQATEDDFLFLWIIRIESEFLTINDDFNFVVGITVTICLIECFSSLPSLFDPRFYCLLLGRGFDG